MPGCTWLGSRQLLHYDPVALNVVQLESDGCGRLGGSGIGLRGVDFVHERFDAPHKFRDTM
jgi:hypothetical protein